MPISRQIAAAVTVVLLLAVVHVSNLSAATINDHYFKVDVDNREATFHVEFDRPPDFFTMDSAGRRADSFQYHVLPNHLFAPPSHSPSRTIIRGSEIDASLNFPIRSSGGNGGPNSGGWGPVQGSVKLTIDQNGISFPAPLNLLTPGNNFSYMLQTTEFGRTTDKVWSLAAEIPEGTLNGLTGWAFAFDAAAVELLFTSPSGDRLGLLDDGSMVNEIPNAIFDQSNSLVMIPSPEQGPYGTEIRPLGGQVVISTLLVEDGIVVAGSSFQQWLRIPYEFKTVLDTDIGVLRIVPEPGTPLIPSYLGLLVLLRLSQRPRPE